MQETKTIHLTAAGHTKKGQFYASGYRKLLGTPPLPLWNCGCKKNIGLHDHFIWLFNCFIVFYVLYLMFYT
jgi:hypothetical protein